MFFADDDYRAYRDVRVAAKPLAGVAVWCLMPNPVHLIVFPNAADGLRRVFTAAALSRTLRPGKRGPKPNP